MILLINIDRSGIDQLSVYRESAGYTALKKAGSMNSNDLVRLIEQSGLRGRGGAGYSTGLKWRAVSGQERNPHYFICNIAEGEPGSFKDRALLRNPHLVIESTAISAYATGAQEAYIYVRGSFKKEAENLERALQQAIEAGLIGDAGVLPVRVIVHRGEDSYIAGEETALIESLEGKPAIPRVKPPRPFEYGLWDCPTTVNNVETICNVPFIVNEGAEAFREFGTVDSPGTKLICLSGKIARPGLYEVPLGTKLSRLLSEYGGGPLPGRRITAVFPGGPSTPIVPADLDPTIDFEGLKAVGSHLGTGGMIVLDDATDWLETSVEVASFFARESCGTCPPCVVGTEQIYGVFQTMTQEGENAAAIQKIREACAMMRYRGNCAHSRAAALTTLSLLEMQSKTSNSGGRS